MFCQKTSSKATDDLYNELVEIWGESKGASEDALMCLNICNMQSGKSLWEQAHYVYLRCYSNTQLNLEHYNKNAYQSFIMSAIVEMQSGHRWAVSMLN